MGPEQARGTAVPARSGRGTIDAAAKKIGSKQLKNNAVTSKKIKNGTITAADIIAGVLTDSYTKTESDAKYLAAGGKAVDADKLDGKDSAEFLGKTEKAADAEKLDGLDGSQYQQGQAYHGATDMNAGDADVTLFEIPDKVRVVARCSAGPDPDIRTTFLRNWDGAFRDQNATVNTLSSTAVENGDTNTTTLGIGATEHIQYTIWRLGVLSGSEVIQLNGYAGEPVAGADCTFAAMGVRRDSAITLNFIPPIVFEP